MYVHELLNLSVEIFIFLKKIHIQAAVTFALNETLTTPTLIL